MKKMTKFMGTFFLGLCSLLVLTGVASVAGMGTEDMPKSIKRER